MRRHHDGFTLIELITVIVILGIIGTLGISFFVSVSKSYNATQLRAKIISKGRVVIEQVSRRVRSSAPSSVRVSSSGNCIEFMPVVAGVNYVGEVPDIDNDAPDISSLTVSPFNTNAGVGRHLIIGALTSSDIYTTNNPAARVSISALSGGVFTNLNFSNTHSFTLNSIRNRAFIADDPIRFCFYPTTNQFLRYTGYGLSTTGMNDSIPSGASTTVMANDVSARGAVFSLSPGSEDRNSLVTFTLVFEQQGESVELSNNMYIRNVP